MQALVIVSALVGRQPQADGVHRPAVGLMLLIVGHWCTPSLTVDRGSMTHDIIITGERPTSLGLADILSAFLLLVECGVSLAGWLAEKAGLEGGKGGFCGRGEGPNGGGQLGLDQYESKGLGHG